jgi:hypothetical protein
MVMTLKGKKLHLDVMPYNGPATFAMAYKELGKN